MTAELETDHGRAVRGHGRLPPLPDGCLLPRQALVDRLLGTPAGGLCLVDAAAGCGGTTLLLAAASRSASPVAWVSLTGRAASPESFWRRVRSALAQAGVPVDAVTTAGEPVAQAEQESLLTGLVDALGGYERGVLLVVTDLDARLHQPLVPPLQALIESLPPTTRMAVRVRGGQPFDVSRLLAGGRLCLLGEDDLALSVGEAEGFLACASPQVPPERRALLASLCEGRVGPLAATVAGAGPDPLDDPVAWLLGPGVDLLFQAEVDALEDGDRQLLVGCSVLEVLTPDACDGVLGSTDSAARLVRLERARVIRHQGSEPASGYRVHGLLAEHLRRLLAQRGRGAEAQAHRLAASWLVAQGEAVESAITHLLAAGDVREAMSLLETHLSTLLDDGRVAAVRRWYRAAPGAVVTDEALHVLGSAWAEVMGGNIAGAEHQVLLLHEAVERLSREAAQASMEADALMSGPAWLAAETELLHAYVDGWHGYPGRLLAHVRRARAFYGAAWDRSAHQVAAFLQIRGHLWAGDPVGARPLLLEAVGRARTREYFRLVVIPSLRALLAVEEGRAHRAAHLAGEAIAWLDRNGVLGSVDHCDARLARSRALLDLDDVPGAETEALLLLGQAAPVEHATYEMLAHLVLAAVRAARDDAVGAMSHVDLARQVARVRAPGSDLLASIDEAEARLRLDLGDDHGTLRLVRRLPPGVERELLLARALGPRAGPAAARTYREIRPTTPRQVVDLQLLVASSLARSRPLEAEDHLLAAAEAAYEYGMHRVLVGRPAGVVALADRAGRRSGSVAVARLVEVARQPRTSGTDRPPIRLSRGELELLMLLPSVRGNAELAEDLGVSVNTVKTRLRRLFAKLEVHDRDAAVRRAVSLGLVR